MKETDILEERRAYIQKIFDLAKRAGMCRTKQDFANLIGFNRAGLSSAMNLNPEKLTESLELKVRRFAFDNGLDIPPITDKKADAGDDIVIPAKTAKMYENMTETIRIQAQLLAQYQSTAIAGGLPQKNTPSVDTERK